MQTKNLFKIVFSVRDDSKKDVLYITADLFDDALNIANTIIKQRYRFDAEILLIYNCRSTLVVFEPQNQK